MLKLNFFLNQNKIITIIGLISLISTLYFGKVGLFLFILCSIIIIIFEYIFLFQNNKKFNPYILFIFSPILLINYSSITDFKIRLLCFLFLIYIINIAYTEGSKKFKLSLINSKPITIFLISFILFSLSSFILYFQDIHLSGDEPHFIMITQSIVEDGDFDLKNNINNKTYFKYLPVNIQAHSINHKGKYLSYHMPGVSFLLIPFYFLFNLIGGIIPPQLYFRLAASIINAFFALSLFYLLKLEFPDKNITGFWLLFISTFPLIFHSVHLYPELPSATLMISAFIFAFSNKKKYLLSGLSLSLIPWFHVKYYPALIVIGLVIFFKLLKEKNIKHFIQFFIFPALSFILLMTFCKTLYGSFNPANIFPKQNYFAIPISIKIRALLAYFFDQRDGLLFYTPIFFFTFFSFKKRVKNQNILIWISLSYILFHAFTTVRGAYAPAGRPLIFVSWIFIVFIINYIYSIPKDNSKYILKIVTGFTIFILIWLFYYPLFVYQPVFSYTTQGSSSILNFFSSDSINLSILFPSFLNFPKPIHIPNYIWMILITMSLLIFYLKPLKLSFTKRKKQVISFILFFTLTYIFCFYPHVHLINKNKYSNKNISFFNNSRNFVYIKERKIFRVKNGNKYDLFLDLKKNKNNKIIFNITNPEEVAVVIRNGKTLLFDTKKDKKNIFSIELSKLKKLTVNNKTVIHIGINTKALKSNPFLFIKINSNL